MSRLTSMSQLVRLGVILLLLRLGDASLGPPHHADRLNHRGRSTPAISSRWERKVFGVQRSRRSTLDALHAIPRGGGDSPIQMAGDALRGLADFMKGPKADTLTLLFSTALNTPICQKLGVSPILGFLGLGLFFGPNGKGLIHDVHTIEMLADLGIVLFLFEMGIHLDFKTLMAMKTDVFGIGLGQFSITAIIISAICGLILKIPAAASIIIGWSLALSSSAFVLQLLKDKGKMETQYGRSSFGTLLLQDLMVVPLLVMTPILAGQDGVSAAGAVSKAIIQITLALLAIASFGKVFLSPLFDAAVSSKSQEAVIGSILATVLGMSFLTEGLGLSNTLGAFLAGMLLSETKHKHRVEHEASPFRGILVGLFFFTVGFEIDLQLITSKPGLVASIVMGIMALKTILATAVCLGFRLPLATAQHVGLVLSQGGEFAFVAFRTARSFGILNEETTKILLTCVSLTMALTPFMEEFGSRRAERLMMATPTSKNTKVKRK